MTISTGLHNFACDIYRTMVPYPWDRIPISANSCLYFIFPHFLLLHLAYLARRADTFLIRLLLLPLTVLSILGTFFRFTLSTSGTEPIVADGLLASIAFSLMAKAIDFACRPEGMLKTDEEKPGVPIRNTCDDHGDAKKIQEGPSIWKCYLPAWLYDGCELLSASRGIGWKFGAGIHIPKECRPMERSAFLRETLLDVFQHWLIIDACDTFIKLLPGVGSPGGGTIFRPEFPVPGRYILSSLIFFATGACIASCFHVCYGIVTLIAVGMFSSEPSSWPPVMDNPWKSDSLHIFWAKRWHQLLRETFFIYGGFIGDALAGDIGKIFGTFIGSGLFHALPGFVIGSRFELPVLLFFVLQAPLLLLEKVWARATGHRVQGFYGQAWTYITLCAAGQLLVDPWYKAGLGGSPIIDPSRSPLRRLFIPFVVHVSEWLEFYDLPAQLQIHPGR